MPLFALHLGFLIRINIAKEDKTCIRFAEKIKFSVPFFMLPRKAVLIQPLFGSLLRTPFDKSYAWSLLFPKPCPSFRTVPWRKKMRPDFLRPQKILGRKKKENTMELKAEKLVFPEGCNIILGHSHFIKTVEDLYEVMVGSTPNPKFGVAFSEASSPCLIRKAGTDDELVRVAVENALRIGAGHAFIIVMRDIFPINVLNAVKQCQEVCGIFCATANPVEVVVAETEQGRGILGVIDGFSPAGIESEEEIEARKALLRKFGYKIG